MHQTFVLFFWVPKKNVKISFQIDQMYSEISVKGYTTMFFWPNTVKVVIFACVIFRASAIFDIFVCF